MHTHSTRQPLKVWLVLIILTCAANSILHAQDSVKVRVPTNCPECALSYCDYNNPQSANVQDISDSCFLEGYLKNNPSQKYRIISFTLVYAPKKGNAKLFYIVGNHIPPNVMTIIQNRKVDDTIVFTDAKVQMGMQIKTIPYAFVMHVH